MLKAQVVGLHRAVPSTTLDKPYSVWRFKNLPTFPVGASYPITVFPQCQRFSETNPTLCREIFEEGLKEGKSFFRPMVSAFPRIVR
jgi:hypothetical protein